MQKEVTQGNQAFLYICVHLCQSVAEFSRGSTESHPTGNLCVNYKLDMPLPVISVAQMREWEKASWVAGRSASDVIDQVGRAIANRLELLTKPGEKILFFAGKGHNGDDVRAARKHLASDRAALLLDVVDPAQGLETFLASGVDG